MFNITSKCFSFFNNKPPATWVAHITRDFLACYSCSYYTVLNGLNGTRKIRSWSVPPPVNSPDQIPPNLTLTLTLTQVGIHRGEIGQGGIFRTSFEHIRLPPLNVVMATTNMYGKKYQRSGYMGLHVTFSCFLILLS